MSDFNRIEWNRIIESIPTTIEYDAKWANGTGYLNGATSVDVSSGPVKFVDDKNRQGIIVCTGGETIVVFERYTPKTESPFVVVCNFRNNKPKGLEKLSAFLLHEIFYGNIVKVLPTLRKLVDLELGNAVY